MELFISIHWTAPKHFVSKQIKMKQHFPSVVLCFMSDIILELAAPSYPKRPWLLGQDHISHYIDIAIP